MFLYAGLVVAGIILGLMLASLIHIYTPSVKPDPINMPSSLYVCCQRCDLLEQPWTELCPKCNGSGTHTPRMFVGDDGRVYRSIYQD